MIATLSRGFGLSQPRWRRSLMCAPQRSLEAIAGPRDAASELAAVTDVVVSALAGVGRPVLLLVDDLHWADPGTAGLLGQLAKTTTLACFGIVATARVTDADETGAGVGVLQDLRSRQDTVVLALGGLPLQAIEELIRRRDGDVEWMAAARLAMQVHDLTGGNALFADELVRHAHDGELVPLPPSVVALVAGRVDRLPVANEHDAGGGSCRWLCIRHRDRRARCGGPAAVRSI